MKIRICEKLPFLLLLIGFTGVQAQITTPIVRGRFGVDADVQNNWFNNAVLADNDDWFYTNGSSSSSVFVIDTTGAGTITAQYAAGIGLTTPFYRKMRYPVHTQLDGTKTLIDAMFVRDYHDVDSTVFALGSNKNGMSPGSWSCPDNQSVPIKNDILDAYVHIRREGPTLSIADTLWMFGGVALESNNGNRYFDFELYQTDILYTRSAHTFSGYGPDAGHTTWRFDAGGNVTQAGDIIFSADYGASTLTAIEARIWIDRASMLMTPAAFNWTGSFEGATMGSQYGYAGIRPKTADPFYFGTENSGSSWAGPFKLVRADNSVVTDFEPNQFMEFGVNLTVLGLNPPTLLGVSSCSLPFTKVLVKTRSSTAFSAELKDFVGPLDLFVPPAASAVADVPMYCGTISVSQLQVINPYPTSTYTWTTSNGNISGSSSGPNINVDQPGTYIVTQTLESGCPTYAADTVVITYDPNCTTLTNNEVSFKGALANSNIQLNWSVTENRKIQYFTIEKSTDGVNFTLAQTVNSLASASHYAAYTATDNVYGLHNSFVYYRLKIAGRDGAVQYSKPIRLALPGINTADIILQPNPVRDHLQINMHSTADRDVQVLVYNVTGKLMKTINSRLEKGFATITLNDCHNWPKGMYTVKLLSGRELFIKRIVVMK